MLAMIWQGLEVCYTPHWQHTRQGREAERVEHLFRIGNGNCTTALVRATEHACAKLVGQTFVST
jgi:hypothetical protein